MQKNHFAVIAVLALVFAGFSSPTYAVLVGNDVSVGRANATDGATDVFQLYPNAPLPYGSVNAFAIFDQNGNQGYTGNGYVLRPTGGNNYKVLYDVPLLGTGTNATKFFPTALLPVLAGDLIATYGRSIPYTDGTLGGSFQQIFYPSPNAPVVGATIVLPSATYPESSDVNPPNGYVRDYAFAANVVPEPASVAVWSVIGLTLGGLGCWRRRSV